MQLCSFLLVLHFGRFEPIPSTLVVSVPRSWPFTMSDESKQDFSEMLEAAKEAALAAGAIIKKSFGKKGDFDVKSKKGVDMVTTVDEVGCTALHRVCKVVALLMGATCTAGARLVRPPSCAS